MLQITIPGQEYFDERTETFITVAGRTVQLEHSLISISKWESKWHKPFLGTEQKTIEESVDYVRCMTITQNVDPNIYLNIDYDLMQVINSYIDAPMTATTFGKDPNQKPNKDIITAEIVYYWMVALQIPFECEKWHFNRLMTLIKVCNIKNQPKKKETKKEAAARHRRLNAARRKKPTK